MPHRTDLLKSMIDPWTNPKEYPGAVEHFTEREIARVAALDEKDHMTFWDKRFLMRMYRRLIRTAL